VKRRRFGARTYAYALALMTVSASLGLFYCLGNPPPASTALAVERWFVPHNSSSSIDLFIFDDRNASLDEKLALVSAQGLMNRQTGHVYVSIDRSEELTSFIQERKDIRVQYRDWDWLFANRTSEINGSVIYDPGNLDTVNIATMYSSSSNLVIASPGMAEKLKNSYGIEPKLDLRSGEWSGLRSPEIYRKALAKFPTERAAILRPEKWALRDYLISSNYFVFYVPQGPVALPSDVQAMQEILRSTASGPPLLGWFEMPTLAEENFAVQLISRSGKGALGGEDVPNLSYLSGLNASAQLVQKRDRPTFPQPGKRAYIAFAMPDGDNIDFATRTMLDMWKEPKRGSLPVAWSISPSLAESP
jgi:hypothetical protein